MIGRVSRITRQMLLHCDSGGVRGRSWATRESHFKVCFLLLDLGATVIAQCSLPPCLVVRFDLLTLLRSPYDYFSLMSRYQVSELRSCFRQEYLLHRSENLFLVCNIKSGVPRTFFCSDAYCILVSLHRVGLHR